MIQNIYELGIIGLGKMGNAILQGILETKLYLPNQIILFDINNDLKNKYNQLDLKFASSEREILLNAKKVILAIKPQSFDDFFMNTKELEIKCVLISIAAGIKLNTFTKHFGNIPCIRVMPNTPALIKKAASAISKNEFVSNEIFSEVKEIFSKIGAVEEIEEKLMDDVVPLNGSMPAYLYLFAKTFIDNATNKGLDINKAKILTCEAIKGSCDMILNSSKTIDELINDVCSPNGTTLAGLKILKDNQFETIVNGAIEACIRRSIELGKK